MNLCHRIALQQARMVGSLPVASIIKSKFEYKDSNGDLFEGVLARPNTGTKMPGVLVLHAFGGCKEFEIERAVDLARNGFVALAADVYGKGIRGNTMEENFALMRPMVEGDRAVLARRLQASRDALANLDYVDETKLGAIGYCFGGLSALDMARRNVAGLKAAVSFHGNPKPIPGAPLTAIEAGVQVHNGQADVHIGGPEQIKGFYEEMNARKADWMFIEHGFALHGFTEPHADKLGIPLVGYQKKAADRSWAMTEAFLKQKLIDE